MRRLALLIIILLIPIAGMAQKKDLAAARDWLKAGKNLDKAEASMTKLLADSANRLKPKIWETLFEAQRKQYEEGNEKLYLHQQYDTASLFNITSRMFSAMEAFDSIEVKSAKRQDKPEHRKDNAELLNRLRPNLFNGGLYFIRKQDFAQGYRLLDQYIDAANQPLFHHYNYYETDSLIPEAAYWAVYAAYKMKDARRVLHHTYLALKKESHKDMMLQFLSSTYQQEGDTTRWLQTLKEGFDSYPLSPFFFSHLISYYFRHQQWDEALQLTDQALQADSTSQLFLLTKSSVLLNRGDYAESFALSDSLIQHNDSLTDAYLNAGLAKFNQAVVLDKQVQGSRRRLQEIKTLYREALPYLEAYRKQRPDEKQQWGLPLYTIYLNLNMGKEFDEIDKILKRP